MLLLHQIAEDAFQRVIEWFHPAETDRRRLGEPRELDLEIEHVPAQDHHRAVRVDMHGIDGSEPDDLSGQPSRSVAKDADVVWPLVECGTNGAEAAGRCQ